LIVQRLKQEGPITAEIDLDDMEFIEGNLFQSITLCPPLAAYGSLCMLLEESGGGVYVHPCRCSGEYRITQADLEGGFDLVGCSTCSLRIRVLYSELEDEEQ